MNKVGALMSGRPRDSVGAENAVGVPAGFDDGNGTINSAGINDGSAASLRAPQAVVDVDEASATFAPSPRTAATGGNGHEGGAGAAGALDDDNLTIGVAHRAGSMPTTNDRAFAAHADAKSVTRREAIEDFATATSDNPMTSDSLPMNARSNTNETTEDGLLDLSDLDRTEEVAASSDDFVLDLEDSNHASAPDQAEFSDTEVPAHLFAANSADTHIAAPSVEFNRVHEHSGATTDTESEIYGESDMRNSLLGGDEEEVSLPASLSAAAQTVVGVPETIAPVDSGALDLPVSVVSDDDATATEQELDYKQLAQLDAQVSQLTPEMFDALAHRVVELMSERIVREIAWEVVPELAERMIRRRLEEEKS